MMETAKRISRDSDNVPAERLTAEEFSSESSSAEALSPGVVNTLLEYISAVKFGSVTVKIQDGKVVQIEKSEKTKVR